MGPRGLTLIPVAGNQACVHVFICICVYEYDDAQELVTTVLNLIVTHVIGSTPRVSRLFEPESCFMATE